MKEANERTDDDIEAILEFLLHFPVRFKLRLNKLFIFFYFKRHLLI
jgi:hypothetical protein